MKLHMTMYVRAVFVLTLLSSINNIASAMSVSPMQFELGIAGRQQVVLDNDGTKPATVELQIQERKFDEAGNQTLSPAENEFVVFPPLAAVQPGKSQAFQLQHVGELIDTSKSYYLTVKQLPVDVDPIAVGDGGKVTFLMAFNVAVQLVPEGTEPSLTVASVVPAASGVEVVFANEGDRYLSLENAVVEVKADGSTMPLDEAGIEVLKGQNIMNPGDHRRVLLPLPTGISGEVSEVLAKLKN